jgi:hypothetical protein
MRLQLLAVAAFISVDVNLASAQNGCIRLVRPDSFTNKCDDWLEVKWVDAGSCSGGNCQVGLAGGQSRRVTAFNGGVCWEVCVGRGCSPRRPHC